MQNGDAEKTAQAPAATAAAWRDRIVGEGTEAPATLKAAANPLNWRLHSDRQRQALGGVLDEVGWVQRVILNRTTGNLVDGHLRVDMANERGEPTVPVLYVELTEAEEHLVLAALDPVAAMADADGQILAQLHQNIATDNVAVQGLLEEVAKPFQLPAAGEWGAALDEVPTGDHPGVHTIPFVLTTDQYELVQQALAHATAAGPFGETGNANAKGNALARICASYLTGQ